MIVNRLVAVILFLSLSFQCLVKLGIVAWYEVNKTYVATVLCENKDKPQLNCCGKCYVNKQIKKVDDSGDNEKQAPGKNQSPRLETVEFVMPQLQQQNTTFFLQDNKVYNGYYTACHSTGMAASIFHPPSVG